MLSALLAESTETEESGEANASSGARRWGLLGVDAGGPDRGMAETLGLSGAGVAPLSAQTETERAYAPLPSPSGHLIHDPDFSLPTAAGPLAFRLFHYSTDPDVDNPFGYGRRASWPIRLCAEQQPQGGPAVTVLLEREDGQGARFRTLGDPTDYTPLTPRVFDRLEGTPSTGFTLTDFDTGTRYRWPVGQVRTEEYDGRVVTLPYLETIEWYETVHGKRVNFSYADAARKELSSITDPASRAIQFRYDSDPVQKHVTEVEDWGGRIRTFSYAGGTLRSVQDPLGYRTTFDYDCDHRLTEITDPNGYVTTYTYDGKNRVTSRKVDGRLHGYAYSGTPQTGQTVRYFAPEGDPDFPWITTTDAQGNVLRVQEPPTEDMPAVVRRAQYNAQGLPVSLWDGLNRQTILGYDANGRETYRQEPNEGAYEREYDPTYGNLLWDRDPLGRETVYTYDVPAGDGGIAGPERRLVHTEENPLGKITTYTYRGWGALESVETPLGFRTTYTYNDSHGVLTAERDARGGIRNYTVDVVGNRTVEEDEVGRRTTYGYDTLDRVVSVRTGMGGIRTTVYDGVGNVVVSINPLGFRTSYTYDALQNETVELDARGYRYTTVYDSRGRETQRTDPNGNSVYSVHDAADRRIAAVDALGRRTTTIYDLARRVVGVQDTTGLLYQTSYPPTSAPPMVVGQVTPSGHRTTSIYDDAGQLVATIDTTGNQTAMGYDGAGRLEVVVEPTGARTTTVYDPNGRSTAVINALGYRATSVYDQVGNLTVSIDPEGRRFTTVYNLAGDRTREESPDGTFVERLYDPAGRNHVTIDYLGNRTTTQYDLADQVTVFTDEQSNTFVDEYDPVGMVWRSRDQFNQVSQITYDGARQPTVFQSTTGNSAIIGRNAADQITQYTAGGDDITYFDYEASGRFRSSRNYYGDRYTIGYDAVGRVNKETYPDSSFTWFLYDEYSRWFGEEYPGEFQYRWAFDDFNRLIATIDEAGYRTTMVRDLLNRPIAEIDALGYRSTVSYDAVGRVKDSTDPLGRIATTTFDARGNVQFTMDALGQRTTYYYDQFSRLEAVENPLGYRSSYHYDVFNRVDATKNARGYSSSTVYDQFGRVAATINALGQRTTTHYDIYGRAEAIEEALGFRTTTIYDVRSRVIGTKDALGFVTTTVYDNAGRVAATVDALGRRTTTIYDAASRVAATQDALGFRTSFVYDGRSNQIAQINARGYRTTSFYDARSLPTGMQDALGYRTTTHYDALGRAEASEDAFGYRSTTFYDGAGQVTARQGALGYRTTSFYDVLGRTVATEDALGRRTTSVYDPLSRIVASINALGRAVTSIYDAVGNQLAEVTPLGYRTSHSYDPLDRPFAKMDPLGRVQTTAYDAAGRMVAGTDAKGQTTTHLYNARGEETGRLYSGIAGGDALRLSMLYDPAGQMVAVHDVIGRTSYTYDALGRVKSVYMPGSPGYPNYPDVPPITYAYDGTGNRVGMATPWGTFTYAYDALDRLEVLSDPGYAAASVAGGMTTFSYDGRGQRSQQESPNATRSTYAYDALGRTLQVQHSKVSDGTVVERAFYSYDPAGRPLYKATLSTRHTYSYDALDQLTAERVSASGSSGSLSRVTTWNYDANDRRLGQARHDLATGRITRTSYLYDAADQMLQSSTLLPQKALGTGTLAVFVQEDTVTQGDWKGAYGEHWSNILQASGNPSTPGWVTVTPSGKSDYTWAASTSERRALQQPASPTDRIAACWSGSSSFDIRVNCSDASSSNLHQVALYFLDWDNYGGGRHVRVDVLDTSTSAVLASREVTQYQNGKYLVFNIRGDVTLRIVNLNGSSNATVSGIFLDPVRVRSLYGYDRNGSVTRREMPGDSMTLVWDGANRLERVIRTPDQALRFRYGHDGLLHATERDPQEMVWFEDGLPPGASPLVQSENWNWMTPEDAAAAVANGGSHAAGLLPNHGYGANLVHVSWWASGGHQHAFDNSTTPLTLQAGDILFAYIWIDPLDPPSEVMLQWNRINWAPLWDRRAYWGTDSTGWGTDGTPSRWQVSPNIPPTGRWVRLEVSASDLDLVGRSCYGMTFTLVGGQAVWGRAGKLATSSASALLSPSGAKPVSGRDVLLWDPAGSASDPLFWDRRREIVFVQDAVPAGATSSSSGGDSWSWQSANPTPYSGALAHRSATASGFHRHRFSGATNGLAVAAGDVLFHYVYLDPANPPREVLVEWYDGSGWEHRAYWGENLIGEGTNDTDSRRYMGALPPVGEWVRLEVPASKVGLESVTVTGMAFGLYDGGATWDRSGVMKVVGTGGGRQALVQMPDAASTESHLVRSVGELRQGLTTSGDASVVNRVVHADALGSVEAVTAGDGSVSMDAAMDAWGNPLPLPGTGGATSGSVLGENPAQLLGGLGYWNEPDLGLHYVRARWLDTGTGSWLSVDPVEGEPRYSYVRSMPTTGVDPSGLQSLPSPQQVFKDVNEAFADLTTYIIATALVQPLHALLRDNLLKGYYSGEVEKQYRHAIGGLESTYGKAKKSVTFLIDPFTMGAADAAWHAGKKYWWTGPLEYLYPPHPNSKQMVSWMGGFAWGVGSVLLEEVVGAIEGLPQLLILFVQMLFAPERLLSHVLAFLHEVFNSAISYLISLCVMLGGLKNLPYYDRGRILGRWIGRAVALIISLLGYPEAIIANLGLKMIGRASAAVRRFVVSALQQALSKRKKAINKAQSKSKPQSGGKQSQPQQPNSSPATNQTTKDAKEEIQENANDAVVDAKKAIRDAIPEFTFDSLKDIFKKYSDSDQPFDLQELSKLKVDLETKYGVKMDIGGSKAMSVIGSEREEGITQAAYVFNQKLGGPGTMLFKPQPTVQEVFEELYHFLYHKNRGFGREEPPIKALQEEMDAAKYIRDFARDVWGNNYAVDRANRRYMAYKKKLLPLLLEEHRKQGGSRELSRIV